MAAVLLNGTSLSAPDEYAQGFPQASSPASPSASFMIQQPHPNLPSYTNGSTHSDHSQPTTPTSYQSNIPLDPPPNMPFSEYLRTWQDGQVAAWLTTIKCPHQAQLFKENDIRGDVLLELDQVTLKEMGMFSVGDRIRIVAGVKALRHKCSAQSSASSSRPRIQPDHGRSSSFGSESGGSFSSSGRAPPTSKRLDNGRPAPLHLTPNNGSDTLPRLIRDGQDSARATQPTIRPLPQPIAHSQGNRPGLPPVPPPPRSQLPPAPNLRTPQRSLIPPSTTLPGRRTPTLPDPPPFTNQPLPPAPNANLLTPTSDHAPRQPPQGARPLRSPSPLHNSQLPNRNLTRSPHEHGRTPSTSGIIGGQPMKLPPRTTSNQASNSHPYALQPGASSQTALSPIAENFNAQRHASGTPSPPTSISHPFRPGVQPFNRPNTPSHAPSLDDINRKVIKFSLPDGGKWSKISVADCTGGADILLKALKKLRGVEDVPLVETVDGALCVDGWGAFADWHNDGGRGNPLTEAQLMSICQASPDEPVREHGLTLRLLDRGKSLEQASPRLASFPRTSGSMESLSDSLKPSQEFTSPVPGSKAFKRASSVSILSGLGVQIPDPPLSSSASLNIQESPSKSPNKKGKLRNFFGQRPPSELITNHLAEYFPFTEKKVLERTRRQSMFRGPNTNLNRRDSIISWNPPHNQSRFSVSTQGSGNTIGTSPRNSISSRMSVISRISPPLRPTDDPSSSPPRVSISAEDGHSIHTPEVTEAQRRASRRMSRPHLLPPVPISSESLADSLNLTSSRSSSRMSIASSKRMSYITELRSKRDRSDTASMITVDEITAEVESRRESSAETSVSDDWTAVDPSDVDAQSIKEISAEDEDEEEGEEEEEMVEEEEEEELTEGVDTDEEGAPGKAITSHGEKTIKWIKGALIGAGSFGKVYLGMDAASGLLMAVKQVELPTGSAPNEERKKTMLSALEHEIELLKDLHHENIVQYHSSCVENDHLNIFLEYVPGGSVTSLLRNYGAFEEPLVRNWVRQILLGLNYLHEMDIIHRDIKGANMLVDNKGGIKISDFGISKKVEDNLMPGHRAHRPSLQGSVFWMAPEVVKQTAYTTKADIWSVGCLVVEMLTGEHPYPQLSQMQAIFKIGMSSKPTIPPDISAEAESFLQLTFELDHNTRPSAAELLKHPWIANQTIPLMQ